LYAGTYPDAHWLRDISSLPTIGTNHTFDIPIILGNRILLGTELGDVARFATAMANSSRNSVCWRLI